MRQGYIDSQGNKYILTGIKAQFPKWTYAQWQAEGEPEIPWIRTDAPSGYRKVSADDVSYDNNTSVSDMIDVEEIVCTNVAVSQARCFRIGHLVILDTYAAADQILQNAVWLNVPAKVRPSSNITTFEFLQRPNQTWGSCQFTLDTSGDFKCTNNDVWRGGVKLCYYI